MPAPPRPALLLAALALVAGACGPSALRDVVADAGQTPAPARDARLAEAGYEQVAAWIRQEIAESDRPVIVKYFASWCGPCAAEAPVLLDAAEAHPEVAMLGIAHQDPLDDASDWIDEHGVDAIPTLLDLEGRTARRLGARGMPSVSFVDVEGRLLYTHTGPIDEPLLEAWIEHLAHDGPRPSARPDEAWTPSP